MTAVRLQLLNATSECCGSAEAGRWQSAPVPRRPSARTRCCRQHGQARAALGRAWIIQRVEATDCVKQKKTCGDHALR